MRRIPAWFAENELRLPGRGLLPSVHAGNVDIRADKPLGELVIGSRRKQTQVLLYLAPYVLGSGFLCS